MRFAEIVICEIESDRSLKILKLLAERVGQPRQSAAVHTQSEVLTFNMRSANAANMGHCPGGRGFDRKTW